MACVCLLTYSQACTCFENKPWQNPIILQLIKSQWWSRKGKAKKLGNTEEKNLFINPPITMIALVATVVSLSPNLSIYYMVDIECSTRLTVCWWACSQVHLLTSWTAFSGTGEWWHLMELGLTFFLNARWVPYHKLLEQFSEQSPKYLTKVKKLIQDATG